MRAENQFFVLIEAELCCQRAAAVGAGNRVGGHALRQVLRQVSGEGGQYRLFGAADVADDGVGL